MLAWCGWSTGGGIALSYQEENTNTFTMTVCVLIASLCPYIWIMEHWSTGGGIALEVSEWEGGGSLEGELVN